MYLPIRIGASNTFAVAAIIPIRVKLIDIIDFIDVRKREFWAKQIGIKLATPNVNYIPMPYIK
ncbi:hypothetical protein HZS_5126 [Henneguya salminicola]|nr:hypothetical protein HZS_5126 [Henneguya salminicola]